MKELTQEMCASLEPDAKQAIANYCGISPESVHTVEFTRSDEFERYHFCGKFQDADGRLQTASGHVVESVSGGILSRQFVIGSGPGDPGTRKRRADSGC